MALENEVLTVWEQKERDGLLALETDEWREKRQIAEDPNTTADLLSQFASEISAAIKTATNAWLASVKSAGPDLAEELMPVIRGYRTALLRRAIFAHPNLPANTLFDAFNNSDNRSDYFTLCRNPALPFFVLELPDFWYRIGSDACKTLLSQENLPLSVVDQLTHHFDVEVRQSTCLHIALAGEIQTENDRLHAITQLWQMFDFDEGETVQFLRAEEDMYRAYYTRLVEWGMAPAWGFGKFAKDWFLSSFCCYESQTEFLDAMSKAFDKATAFERFAGSLCHAFDEKKLFWFGQSDACSNRLSAAFTLPFSDLAFSDDEWNRSPLDLLNHLAHDGNRFVRWAARTRLQDPDFVFTWDDER